MYRLWVRILDDDGDTATLSINFPDSFTLAEVQGFAAAWLLELDAIIDGAITEAGISVVLTLPGGLAVSPTQYTDVQHGALFAFRTAGNYNTSHRVPTFVPAKFAAGSKNVDTTDSDVIAYVASMNTGIDVAGTMVQPSDYRGDDISVLSKAVESFRK